MLNTKDIKTGGNGSLPKTLSPGNQVVTIFKVELEEFKFKPGALHVLIHVEGEDLGKDFQGWAIDKNHPELGNHKGQISRVKASEWAYADATTKSGMEISRDQEMLKFLKTLCIELNCLAWLEGEDGKHSTIESLYAAFNKAKPFEGKKLNVCLAGKEYTNKEGYTAYELFFPKANKTGVPFEIIGKEKSRVIKYNEADHLKKKNVEDVKTFGNDDNASGAIGSDFRL
jgi:hypothetical protein